MCVCVSVLTVSVHLCVCWCIRVVYVYVYVFTGEYVSLCASVRVWEVDKSRNLLGNLRKDKSSPVIENGGGKVGAVLRRSDSLSSPASAWLTGQSHDAFHGRKGDGCNKYSWFSFFYILFNVVPHFFISFVYIYFPFDLIFSVLETQIILFCNSVAKE